MIARPHLRKFNTSFLYPAVLGAGIAWWVQALGAVIERSASAPADWSLWFGAWLLVYHGTWYHHELVSTSNSSSENQRVGESGAATTPTVFGWRQGLANLIDVIALPVAFLGLGFATGSYGLDQIWLTWGAAASIPLAALLNNLDRLKNEPWKFASLAIALAVPLIALFRPEWSRPPNDMSSRLLLAWWIILGVYAVKPEWFASGRVRKKPVTSTPEPEPDLEEPKPAVEEPAPAAETGAGGSLPATMPGTKE